MKELLKRRVSLNKTFKTLMRQAGDKLARRAVDAIGIAVGKQVALERVKPSLAEKYFGLDWSNSYWISVMLERELREKIMRKAPNDLLRLWAVTRGDKKKILDILKSYGFGSTRIANVKVIEGLKGLKRFADMKRFADANFQRLGSGSGRIVYAIDDKTVLKLAKNAKGVAQNFAESDGYMQQEYDDVVAKVHLSDSEDRYIVSERLKKVGVGDFRSLARIDFKDFSKVVWYTWLEDHGRTRFFAKPDAFNKPNVMNNPFLIRIVDLMRSFDMPSGDLMRKSSYGKTVDGRLVLADTGLSIGVYQEYYER